ncbi:hypothetical protein [Cellulomonas fimi]|uniref:Integral membrane protein n=1 Tax=Cellulomonas fimi (strain ATCC 484 / DSM 20113 / JCM 1341 / CCUG 24087 / LMG 16345 / NBRC 15513 / NCIMB 8980 / NCTC 7547 / NRS-133) TaxID=590998 RepID=F4H6H3_CELFA|nr:hypothetical protein [Cellulomonas fimi]AEE45606.1 hypothetical protein Celf_1471 [Cellulomonas fimi ATCC 484]NNH05886.1 hypothetical protein [Cellulomonas fimi]VEH30042.1 Uncharacterised protein [Cellulomonas fimi]
MTSTTADPTATPTRRGPATSRAWAWTGVAAGALGVAAIQASMATSTDWEKVAGDPVAILEDAATKQSAFLVFHVLATLTVVLLPVFAAGLRRRLDQQAPAGSLQGMVAATGLVLTAAALLLGSGLDTQFTFAFADTSMIVPESGAFYTDWVATIPWLWLGAGLSALALGVASLRHAAAPRWIGWVSVVLGGLTVLTGISPLQYLSGFVGPIWLLVVALGFALGDRR